MKFKGWNPWRRLMQNRQKQEQIADAAFTKCCLRSEYSFLCTTTYCRRRPNFSFFVFGAEKLVFFIFRPFIFQPKKMHIFSVVCIFRYRYGHKNKRKQCHWTSGQIYCDRRSSLVGKNSEKSLFLVYTRNTLDCDQSNYSSRIVFPSYILNLAKPEVALFDSPTPKIPSKNQTQSKSESDDPPRRYYRNLIFFGMAAVNH